MIRRLLACALCALLPASALARPRHRRGAHHAPAPQSPAPSAKPFVFPYPIHSTQLANGLTVVRVPYPSKGLVAYYSLVRVGSRNEVEPGRTGFAHFFEHMMFRGTVRFPEAAREKFLESVGANDNAYTTDDFTLFHTLGPSTMLQKLVEIEADRFQHLAYSKADFQTEAKAVLGEYHKDAAGPELKVEETLDSTAFTRHPYQHTTLGYLKDVERMPQEYDYSKQFFARWYTPDDVILFIVGDFDDAKLMTWINAQYGPWQGHAADIRIPVEPRQMGQREVEIDWPEPTLPRLIEAWHVPASTLSTSDEAIVDILGPYFAGPTSPLYRKLVLEQQWAQSVEVASYDHRDPGLLTFSVTLKDPSHFQDVEKVFNKTIRSLVTSTPPADQIDAIKSNLRYGLLMGLDSPDHVAEQLAFYAGVLGVPDALPRFFTQLGAVQPMDVRAFAKAHLLASNRTILTLRSRPTKAKSKASSNAQKGGH